MFLNAALMETGDRPSPYYASVKQETDGYLVTLYDVNDRLVMEGQYSSLKDGLNKNKEGVFIYYWENGWKSQIGPYRNNLKQGKWKVFANKNGNLKTEETYKDDSLDGICVRYDPGTGKKTSEDIYSNGKLNGRQKRFKNDSLKSELDYKMGKIEGELILYGENGIIKKRIRYQDGELTEAHLYDEQGNELKYTPSHSDSAFTKYTYVEQMPAPRYDMNEFLIQNIVYPPYARRKRIEGRVVVKFLVDEQGNIGSVHVVQGVSSDLDEEAQRVVSLFPKWRPGMQYGDYVKVWFTIPINFKL
jgi:TonB family protein